MFHEVLSAWGHITMAIFFPFFGWVSPFYVQQIKNTYNFKKRHGLQEFLISAVNDIILDITNFIFKQVRKRKYEETSETKSQEEKKFVS